MASYLRRLGYQYRQLLLHSNHICSIIHIMFHCSGLIFMCVIPVVCVTNKEGGVVVLFDYTTLFSSGLTC